MSLMIARSFLREQVFLSGFKAYPARHWHAYERPLLTHRCWQSWPRAQASGPAAPGEKIDSFTTAIWSYIILSDKQYPKLILSSLRISPPASSAWNKDGSKPDTSEPSDTWWWHVLPSGFKTYPLLHLQMYESSVSMQMCWHSCPRAHGSAPEKETASQHPELKDIDPHTASGFHCLREHVARSAFNTNPSWHKQMWESPSSTQMCWQLLFPPLHVAEPEEETPGCLKMVLVVLNPRGQKLQGKNRGKSSTFGVGEAHTHIASRIPVHTSLNLERNNSRIWLPSSGSHL